jgi:DNA-directed RNA polymerase specialized sigma24 family protein
MVDTTEQTLVNNVLAGDSVAVRKLYAAMEKRLKAFFLPKVLCKEDAEELVQDTFYIFWMRCRCLGINHY